MEFKDYYAVLGLAKSASEEDIKRAYRKLARKFHPDLNPGDRAAETRFKELNEANEVLGDPEKRRKYDELGANWRAYEQQASQGRGPWTSGSYRTVTPDEMRDLFGGGSFSDFFQTFFGGGAEPHEGGRRSRHVRHTRGEDVEAVVDLTLEEAQSGTTRRVTIGDTGGKKPVEVRIPAGVKDGARVRAAGEGAAGPPGGAAGDLYLRVRVRPHARFERRDRDLHTRIGVPVTIAVLGGEVSVPMLGGGSLRLKIPEGTGAGRVFRLRGHGMPTVGKPDDRGDLYATVDVQIPTSLSHEERRHYEALRQLAATPPAKEG